VREESLEDLLVLHRETLRRHVERRAGWLLRYDSADDLLQGILVRALERGEGVAFESERRFLAWLKQVARSYLADRSNHWTALKRRSAALLRITAGDVSREDGHTVAIPPADVAGPSTVAQRREQLSLAVKVLGTLSERDRRLVRWSAEGVPLREVAERLDITHDAAKKASARAMERFRKAYRFAAEA
jgi:RNA polymerase sigma factor (sigma-70 family)